MTRTAPIIAASPPNWRRPAPRLVASLATAALLLAACGDSSDSANSGADTAGTVLDQAVRNASGDAQETDAGAGALGGPSTTAAPTGATQAAGTDGAAPAGEAPATAGLGAGVGGPTVPNPADLGRQLIFTAEVEVEVDDVAAATDAATAAVARVGGFLFGQSTTGGADASSQLTFKVKPQVFDQALDALGEVGKLRNQTVTTDDVTERVVDLDSRIQVAQLGVERLRTALAETTNLKDYAEIEALLLQRESDLEVMKGQQRTLADQVALATINLTLTQDRLANNISLAVTAYEGRDQGVGCPGQGDTRIPAGDAATVCFDITNEGDQTLTKITVTDTVLGIDAETELITVFGSLDSLAPGQSALVAYEAEPERDLRLRTRVTAVPTNGVDPEPTGAPVDARASFDLDTFEPDRDPGFGDGWSAGGRVLAALWTAVTVTLGFLLPMLVILAPLAAAVWWALRRQRRAGGPAAPAQPAPPAGPSGPNLSGGDNPPPPPPAPP
ncbi:MAG: DUF4349 domain-containing protein, partial [Acidimicrobiia bacterium]|nr:DUF4349 domain-containing protein [Acidimicrobiia bacterium]